MSQLALYGGKPIRTKPYPQWPAARHKELGRLEEVLKSGTWGVFSPEVKRLEQMFSAYTGADYALAVPNGTISLEIILRALGIGRGDEVIVPIYTFVASVSAIVMAGATPVFADVLYSTHLADASSVESRITERTKAILAVHIAGRPCDMDALADVAHRHGLALIEDAAQAHGAQWREKRVGSIGTAGSFSFQATKNLPSGEGGMITTNDAALYKIMASIANYGRDTDGDVWYNHIHLGTNGSMGGFQAVILQEQMSDAEELLQRRMRGAAYLEEKLSQFPFFEMTSSDSRIVRNAYHLLMFKYKQEKLKNIPRAVFVKALAAEGVPVIGTGYAKPINTMEFMRSRAFFKATGTQRSYDKIDTPVGDCIAYEQGVWIVQNALLEDQKDMDLFVAAVQKLADCSDALAGGIRNEIV